MRISFLDAGGFMSDQNNRVRFFRRCCIGIAVTTTLAAEPATATYHIAEISEVLTGYNFLTSAQFVEIRMKAGGQHLVSGTKLAAFDQAGVFFKILLTIPGDVGSGADRRWLIATSEFEATSGIQADFELTERLPYFHGMVCWGDPVAGETDPANYVDCVSYGQYRGDPNVHTAAPTPISPSGYSIQRISDTNDSLADFVCGDPITPENNAGESVDLASSAPCGTPTSTTSTSTLQAPPACSDGNEDGNVSATDALLTLATAVGAGSCPLCLCDV
ncbi:MAG TPA: hypothetical protein VFO62_04550, partial [Candidatus Binatia bacterium]|nr:hypothetical protein [Candidatus Binatia bacterium]